MRLPFAQNKRPQLDPDQPRVPLRQTSLVSIRQLGSQDSELYRMIRLRALGDAPTAFGSTYEREAAFVGTVWQERLVAGVNPAFVYQEDDDAGPVGLVAAVPESADSDTVNLVSMWVAPEARRRGVGGELVETVVRWAELRGARTVRLHVTAGNTAAALLDAKYGFGYSGLSVIRERDGTRELEMVLDLAHG
jgi:GNAT superfamily N-acetyltransferase